jgi:hypothetical protein
MLLLACSFAFGQIGSVEDYVLLDYDYTPTGGNIGINSSVALPFLVTHTCAAPASVTGLSLGFVFSGTGSATWTYNSTDVDVDFESWWSLGVNIQPTGMPTYYLIGGASIGGGMVTGTIDHPAFTLNLDMGPGEGEICIDSGFVPPAGAWKFSNSNCDPVGGPRPYFLDFTGSDLNHPICITVWDPPCDPPVINVTPVGDQLSGNHCNAGGISFTFDAELGGLPTDPGDPLVWTVVSGIGGFTGATYSVTGQQVTGTYPVEIMVTNDCGETDTYNFDVVFTNQDPTITNCPAPGVEGKVGQGNTIVFNFDATDPNTCDGLTWGVSIAPASVANAPTIDGTGLMSWETVDGEGGETYVVTVTVDDGEGGTDVCDYAIEVLTSEPFEIWIKKVEDVYQGHYQVVPIFMKKGSEAFGGFDFLVAYDASALTFMGAALASPELNGKWEYFTYRYGWNGNCDGACPSGMLRVIGIADINNGPNHPPEYTLYKQGDPTNLVDLTFYVTNDRTFECMYVPIRFFWHDCGDNAISNVGGDTLWISRYVYDYDWSLIPPYRNITDEIHYGGYGWIPGGCMNDDPEKPSPIEFIDFYHGGIDIICADSIDARGDLNLNKVANEIADVVLYTNYFIYGLSVFDINMEGQIAASDVNNDGRILTVGDLVYLTRIVTGDALPIAKLSPFAGSVTIEQGETVKTNSQSNIGAALFVFDGEGEASLLADGMQMKSDVVNGQLRVLVWSDGQDYVPAGEQSLISVTGNLTIAEVEVSDYYGNLMNSTVTEKVIPTSFALNQNYPNPFNPTTDITINLPTQTNWKLDIYNVAGQLVKTFSGNAIGEVTVTWDAAGAASGIYFYKATAGQYSDTKKMVLMK